MPAVAAHSAGARARATRPEANLHHLDRDHGVASTPPTTQLASTPTCQSATLIHPPTHPPVRPSRCMLSYSCAAMSGAGAGGRGVRPCPGRSKARQRKEPCRSSACGYAGRRDPRSGRCFGRGMHGLWTASHQLPPDVAMKPVGMEAQQHRSCPTQVMQLQWQGARPIHAGEGCSCLWIIQTPLPATLQSSYTLKKASSVWAHMWPPTRHSHSDSRS